MTSTALRTHQCGELRAADIGSTVTLAGWVATRREPGQALAYVDVRDHTGVTQCVVDNAVDVRAEYVVRVTGVVAATGDGAGDAQHVLAPQVARAVDDALGDAGVVAQVDEGEVLAVLPAGRDSAAERHGLADVLGAELAALVGAE